MAFLRPSFIDNMSWEMAEVYGAVTDQILINLAKYFPFWKPGQPVPQSSFEYQASMLAQMGQVNKETIQIIRKGLKGANETLEEVLTQAIIEAVSKSEPGLLDAVKKGVLKPAGIPIVSPNQYQAFNLYYQQAAQKLNLVNTVMLESTKQAYQATVSDIAARVQSTQTALDIGAGETITGVSSWNTAMVHAINRMKQNGIVGFIDHGGHRWSAEAYTAMDIRTTVANTARAAVWETNQNFGNDLYMVSYHDGARPLCYPYQNKVISASNQFGVTYDLDGNEIEYIAQSATTYGQPAGLFGINCKHYPTPFIPGVSVITGDPQNFEDNERAYKESQQQRALERKIREEKRDLLMMKAQGAPAEAIKAQRAKIRATDDEIDAFCDETGRARRQNREGAYTSRVFPDPDTYDVGEFERKQKDEIDKFFSGGGAQQNYTFGQMTPNEQIKPATPVTPTHAPVAPVQHNFAQNATQTTPQIANVSTNIEQFRSAAVGAQNEVEFWMNFTPEQQAAFKASGFDFRELYNMVKEDAPISEWKAPNPGGAESFAIKHDFSTSSIDFVETAPRSDGWMADADDLGIIKVRTGGVGDDWDFIITHEAGHQLSNASPELQQMIMHNPGNILGRFNTRLMAFDGVYGEYNPEEAFATCVSVFVRYPVEMKDRYPEAYAAIEQLFTASPSAREYVDRIREAYRKQFNV